MATNTIVMTHRQRMLAAMRGEPTDQIPWAPRMDLWYTALRARGTVPDRFAGMNTAQIADELGVGCHAVRADYTLPRPPEDLVLRGLGFDNHPDHPYRIELRKLPIEFSHDDGHYQTTIHAPAGKVTTSLWMTKQMSSDGITLPFVDKYPICSIDDLEPVAQVFEHMEVIPTPDAYTSFRERIGERGLAVACGSLTAAPIHLMLHDLSAMEEFYLLYHEQKEAMLQTAKRMEPLFDAILDALVACDAEAVFWGANYDRDTTWPPFFEEQIIPWLQRVSERVHAAGKLLVTHTDGENRGLMHMYSRCGFDVGESLCPAPMTSCTLAELREGFGPDITVWGGIPAVALLDNTMDEPAFEAYMNELLDHLGTGARLILGVSDNVPPDVNLTRLERIQQWVDAFGPVQP